MELVLQVRRIGNSYGIIIPKAVVNRLKIKEGDKIIIEIKRKRPIELFGVLKNIKLDPMGAKNLSKEVEEW